MDPRIAVVGPGAIGTVVAAALHEAGRSPLLCGRSARDGVTLIDGARRIAVPGPVHTRPDRDLGRVDLLLLAVKATQVVDAAAWFGALCDARTVVCVLQNGVEQAALVAPHLPAGTRIVPAVVWFPAQADGGAVRLRGEARLTVPDEPASRIVVDAFAATWLRVETSADFSTVAWRKLLQNAVAGLMALAGRRAGMFRREDVDALAIAYLTECLAVARAEGAALGDEVPRAIVDHFRAQPADLGTSILADRAAGRPLEWDARNGVVLRRARAHGLPTPIGDVVVPLLAAASDGPG